MPSFVPKKYINNIELLKNYPYSTGRTPRVVDDSSYRADSDVIKDFIRSGKAGTSSSGGRYDYVQASPKVVPRKEEEVLDSVLNLRSKSLDMAEVSDAFRDAKDDIKKSQELKVKAQAEENQKKRAEDRQLAVDKALGLDAKEDA